VTHLISRRALLGPSLREVRLQVEASPREESTSTRIHLDDRIAALRELVEVAEVVDTLPDGIDLPSTALTPEYQRFYRVWPHWRQEGHHEPSDSDMADVNIDMTDEGESGKDNEEGD